MGDNDKNHEIDKMVFRKKKRNVVVVLTLSAVSAVTFIILVQNRSLQEEGESLDLLASSPRQEHDLKGKSRIRYYALILQKCPKLAKMEMCINGKAFLKS